MEKTVKKIFVTGATGYVGRRLVEVLATQGHSVYTLTRNDSKAFIGQTNVQMILGDITKDFEMPPAIDTIYHCAGAIKKEDELFTVNVLGTKNIVEKAKKQNCKLIYLSSAGITGNTDAKIITENTPCAPHNAYEISKYEGEKIVTEAIRAGLNAQILRPTTIFGPGKNAREDSLLQLAKSMRTGLYKNIGQGICNIIHVDDVVKALILLDNDNLTPGETYIVNNQISYQEMDQLIKNLRPTTNKKSQHIPMLVAYIAAIILAIVFPIFGKKNSLTFSRIRALSNQKKYSQDKFDKIFGPNEITVQKRLTETYQDYVDAGILP